MPLESLNECPVCKSDKFSDFLACRDYTTSKEIFQLKTCDRCGFVVTSPRPDPVSLSAYYESEKYISHTSESSSIVDSVYLLARSFTLRWKTRMIKRFARPAYLLDYGCGTGEFLRNCSAQGWKSYGVEPSGAAGHKAKMKNEIIVFKTLEELPPIKFDSITLWHVLEHVPDLTKKIRALRELLSENGTLFVAVPNHTSYDAQIYRQFWAGYDVPRHLWHFTKAHIEMIMQANNLNVVEVKPMKLDAFYISILSQKYLRGKFTIPGLLSSLLNGWISNFKARKHLDYSSLLFVVRK